ncbi:hypothetical protein DFH06DRAFT_1141359 [Mycena polygramma]|nr:hypothetical protein DFH06DRAFT_1141359 [Mycena polygramma]
MTSVMRVASLEMLRTPWTTATRIGSTNCTANTSRPRKDLRTRSLTKRRRRKIAQNVAPILVTQDFGLMILTMFLISHPLQKATPEAKPKSKSMNRSLSLTDFNEPSTKPKQSAVKKTRPKLAVNPLSSEGAGVRWQLDAWFWPGFEFVMCDRHVVTRRVFLFPPPPSPLPRRSTASLRPRIGTQTESDTLRHVSLSLWPNTSPNHPVNSEIQDFPVFAQEGRAQGAGTFRKLDDYSEMKSSPFSSRPLPVPPPSLTLPAAFAAALPLPPAPHRPPFLCQPPNSPYGLPLAPSLTSLHQTHPLLTSHSFHPPERVEIHWNQITPTGIRVYKPNLVQNRETFAAHHEETGSSTTSGSCVVLYPIGCLFSDYKPSAAYCASKAKGKAKTKLHPHPTTQTSSIETYTAPWTATSTGLRSGWIKGGRRCVFYPFRIFPFIIIWDFGCGPQARARVPTGKNISSGFSDSNNHTADSHAETPPQRPTRMLSPTLETEGRGDRILPLRAVEHDFDAGTTRQGWMRGSKRIEADPSGRIPRYRYLAPCAAHEPETDPEATVGDSETKDDSSVGPLTRTTCSLYENGVSTMLAVVYLQVLISRFLLGFAGDRYLQICIPAQRVRIRDPGVCQDVAQLGTKPRRSIAEPLGLATQGNLRLAHFVHMYKQESILMAVDGAILQVRLLDIGHFYFVFRLASVVSQFRLGHMLGISGMR